MKRKVNKGFIFVKRMIGVSILILLVLLQFYAILRLCQGLSSPNEYSEMLMNLESSGIKKLFVEAVVIYFALLTIANYDNIENNNKIDWNIWFIFMLPNLILYMTFIHTSIGKILNTHLFLLIGLLIITQIIHNTVKKYYKQGYLFKKKNFAIKKKYNGIANF